MSDPMTNAEVEDILSSIRRLVSEDNRRETPETEKPVDRLVLTPALRVEDPVKPQQDPADVVLQSPPSGDMLSEIGAPAPSEPDVPEAGFSEWAESPAEAPLAFEFRSPKENVAVDPAANLSQPVDPGAKTVPPRALFNVEASQRNDLGIKATTVAVPDTTGSEEPAETDEPDLRVLASADAGLATPSPDIAVVTEEAPAQDFEPEAPVAEVREMETLGEKIAALETLIATRVDSYEPEEGDVSDYAGTSTRTLQWEDTAATDVPEPEVPAEPEHTEVAISEDTPDVTLTSDTADPPPTEETDAVGSDEEPPASDAAKGEIGIDETLLDEEALREIVADIVREELQGALGERITRNVRKLVRREIHRALAAQDLE